MKVFVQSVAESRVLFFSSWFPPLMLNLGFRVGVFSGVGAVDVEGFSLEAVVGTFCVEPMAGKMGRFSSLLIVM